LHEQENFYDHLKKYIVFIGPLYLDHIYRYDRPLFGEVNKTTVFC